MASSGSVFLQTLQEITTVKLEELVNKWKTFEQQKASAFKRADSQHDPLDMLTALADGVIACFSVAIRDGKIVRGSSMHPRLETDLRNLNRFIDQARFDPSVSPKIIQQWREGLLKHLETQSLKYQYADLYGQLTMEWLAASGKVPQTETHPQGSDAMDASDDFEKVSAKDKLEARQNWEQSVFEEAKVDQSAIRKFLNELFGSKEAQKAFKKLRQDVTGIESSLSGNKQFQRGTLRWIIKGLLASDLLTNEKRQVLRDFQSNDVILTELADVLNMRMASFGSWSWGSEVSVQARRQLNGKYHIYMHEDLLQAIFLQYIGVQWSVKIKAALMRFQADTDVWRTGLQKLSHLERQRRAWYIGGDTPGLSVQRRRALAYRAGYFVSGLMDDVNQDLEIEEGDEEAEFEVFRTESKQPNMKSKAPAKQRAPMMAQTQSTGFCAPEEEREGSDEDMVCALLGDGDMALDLSDGLSQAGFDCTPYKPKNRMDAKQRLLHLLSTEILVKTRLHGEITAIRSQYDAWYPSLPHSTINIILEFLGVSDRWLTFFNTFLQAPLKFQGEEEAPRTRKRGTPGSHILSEFFGEMVLFCLDYAVNQQSDGETLWRMHDDIWFWSSSHEQCVHIWQAIEQFNKTMGISLDETKSAAARMQRQKGAIEPAKLHASLPQGEIRWGMIFLDDTTGRFTIDEVMVDKHIEELRRQLKDKERSILSWLQAYSTYASTFFTSNFGKPANCFGRQHLDTMLSMHERIQKTLFSKSENDDAGSVVDWLKEQIQRRFGVNDLPDGYLFFPTALGGLDVKSPFIRLLQLRESIVSDPEALLTEFEEAEKEEYDAQRKKYFARKPWEYPKREDDYRPENPHQYMPFDEYIKFREDINYGYTNQLLQVFSRLLAEPLEVPLEIDYNVELDEALHRVSTAQGQPRTITALHKMDPYWKWVIMLYGPEMLQKFGGFQIVDPSLLPMGMVNVFKSGRVSWQE